MGALTDKECAEVVERMRRSHETFRNGKWLDTPRLVSIETFARCNAACDFCPYTTLDRVGQRLPTETVLRLIDELATFSPKPRQLVLTRVNEPFLDKRLFDFMRYAAEKLPPTKLVLFTNGQALTDDIIDRLNAVPTFERLSISFNEHLKKRYERVMKISYPLTRRRLDNLHRRAEAGELRFEVSLSRVGSSTQADLDYLDWCRLHYPLFPAQSYARFAWIGREDEKVRVPAPDSGCNQWFSLNILANGMDAFCCIDGFGRSRSIEEHSLKELYNDPMKRQLRERLTSRLEVPGCRDCPHGMPSLATRIAGAA